MAAGASPAQYQPAVTPIGGQKHRRRHVVGRDDNSRRHDLISFTRQMPQHTITQIAQIGCTGAEIRIAGPIIRCDFRIDRSAPRPICDLATGNRCKRRRLKVIVFHQRNLESENCFCFIVFCFMRERDEICLGRRQRIDQGLVLLSSRSILTGIMLYGRQTHERAHRDSGGGGPPFDAMGNSMRSMVHPENLRRPALPVLPARPSHRTPPRENKWSNPSAPWSPSP